MHAPDSRVLDLIGTFYDCAIDPAGWPAALQELGDWVGGDTVGITIQDPTRGAVTLVTEWNVPAALKDETFLRVNPLATSGWYFDVDQPFTTANYIPMDEYVRCDFLQRYLAPAGYFDGIFVVVGKTALRYGMLTIGRKQEHCPISEGDVEKVRVLAPHIRRAVTIADLLGARALKHDMLSATLDLLAVGIVLVDEPGRVVHANHAALRQLDARSALRRDGDLLSARDPKSAHELREAIAAASGTTMLLPGTGIVVPLAGADGKDLAGWVLPLDSGLRGELAAPFTAKAAVFVRELGDTSAFPGELFVKRYGITPAECRVLMMLVQGLSVAETCDVLGVAEPTVKTHLSRLFAKTGTCGQSELMRLAMSALAPARSLRG